MLPWRIEPIYAGLGASLCVYVPGWLWRTARSKSVAIAALATLGTASGSWAQAPTIAALDTVAGDSLPRRVVQLPEVVVSTTRTDARAPIARSTLARDEIARRNWGQDTPMLLATLPGAYAYSDAGSGIGYSYLSIRGFPQRRISVLVNGVPLNDPQSHEVYWIDHPDLLASTAEAQVQRGVGSALYGAASVGGSVNLEISPFRDAPGAAAVLGYGSFDTRRMMLEAGSGALTGGWNLHGRYSRIETDGYRERSDSKLWSYAFSARRLAGAHSFRVHLYGGPEETHLAYLGVPRSYLDGEVSSDRERDRRFNPLTYDGERDHFFEPHYELLHSWSPRDGLAFSQTLFYYDGEGFYDEQRFAQSLADYRFAPWTTSDSTLFPRSYYRDTDQDGSLDRDGSGNVTVERSDLIRRRKVQNRHYGWVPRLRVEHAGGAVTVGGELRAHDGRHIGRVLSGNALPPGTPAEPAYYDYHPRTLSTGLFVREEWEALPTLRVTGDLAWRHQSYDMGRDRFDGVRFDQPYDFALPRLGLTWTPRAGLMVFGGWAYSRREPAFRDLYDAEGAGSVPLIADGEPLIRPERVNDFEVGASWSATGARGERSMTLNLFRMDFEDELVFAGQFNTDLGYPTVGNAARSVHQGVEFAGRATMPLGEWSAVLDLNATLSDNHFVRYREVFGTSPGDTVRYDGNAIGFFPAVLGNAIARVGWRGATLGAEIQHAGRIYLDNTEDRVASVAPRTVVSLVGGYRAAIGGVGAEISLRVLNAFDKEYETGGYTYTFDGVRYVEFIPAAKRHFIAQVRMEF
jgi:iron complex outermembrane receptor protein